MHKKLPAILLLMIVGVFFLNAYLPLTLQSILYAISLSIKSVIIFLLPIIIFSLLFKTMVGLAKRATVIIALILALVCLSNFTATFLSHYVGESIYQFNFSMNLPSNHQGLLPAWVTQLPSLIANDKAMFFGICLGLILGTTKPQVAQTIATGLSRLVDLLLHAIQLLIPVFVLGFVVKLQADGVLQMIIHDYALIFGLIAIAQFSYLFFGYYAINGFSLRPTYRTIKNIIPAAIAGFSAMSSAAVMPLTIKGAERNAENKDLASSIIPSTVNIHLLGDCIAIPILAYAVMKSFGLPEPSLMAYSIFCFYFVIAKFSVAAIPGGGILVMLPILESYLGFNSEMLSLITALYILFDPVITCANIFGNGAFARLIDRLVSLRFKTARAI